MEAAQKSDHLLGQPVGEVLLLRIAGQVGERQDSQLDGRRAGLGLERLEPFGESCQVLPELFHAFVAVDGLLGQGLEDDVLQLRRQAGAELGQRLGFLLEDRVDQGLVVVPLEGKFAREQLVEHDSQRPDVRPLVERLPAGLLRRHVSHRAHGRLAFRQRRPALELGQPEVHDLGPALGRDHDVGALDVPVDDAFAVGLPQAGRHLVDQAYSFRRFERPPLDTVPKRLPLDVLHGDVGLILIFPDLVDDTDVRVRQRRGRLGLNQEPLLQSRLVQEVRGQELQGHRALEFEVLGFINDPHSAPADLLDDTVFPGNELVLRYDRERCRQGFRQRIGHPGICGERHPALPAEVRRVGIVRLAFRAFHDHLALYFSPSGGRFIRRTRSWKRGSSRTRSKTGVRM